MNNNQSEIIVTCQAPSEWQDEAGIGAKVQEDKPKLKEPPLYQVVILNDDYTPMDFVVDILEHFFSMSYEKATQVMLQVHIQGRGVCGIYSKDIAQTKASQVNEYSRQHEHPLLCQVQVQ